MKRIAQRQLAAVVVGGLAIGLGGCDRTGSDKLAPAEALDAALRPATLSAAIKKMAGMHYAGTALFRIAPAAADGRKPDEGARDGITTTTELWMDRRGQYRMVESNDQDGGREVVLYGRELAVAIRPGRMIRRAAQEPEPTRLLEEAVGGPWAAWETVRRFTTVERGSAPGVFRLTRSATPLPIAASLTETTALRRWRDTIQVQALEGEATVDPGTGVPLSFKLTARFTATREDKGAKVELSGEIAVNTKVDGIGATPLVTAPPAENLQQRQRTILEERALLGDLGRAAAKEAR